MEDTLSTTRTIAIAFTRTCVTLAILAAMAPAASTSGVAETWPGRPLTIVVPYGAGSAPDVIGRIVAARMGSELGQPIVVENVPGAGGITGTARVARATPDGYQLLLGAAGVLAQNQSLFKHPLYNSVTDFSPVGLIATAPPILIVRKNLPARDLREFIAYAKASPGGVQFGTSGAGSGPHITCLLLNARIGIPAVHVPYRSSLAQQDLLAGRIDYTCDFISTALPQVRAGTVKALATLTRKRAPGLPDLPTADEQGLTGFDAPGWYALVAPRGTPDAVVQRINAALNRALEDPPVSDRLAELGNTVAPMPERTSEYLGNFIESEIRKWAEPIKASGLAMD
jgi:tripartite-type tricarboxylate transporter receptor subunit TctC